MISHDPLRPLFHLRLIARVSLLSALFSLVTLSLLVVYLNHGHGQESDYLAVRQAFMASQESLGVAIAFVSLLLLLLTAMITWLIALYSTFRVAGPLYRFARNLESAIYSGPGTMTPIRHTDELQDEAKALEKSINVLRRHYDSFGAALDEVEWAIDRNDPPTAVAAAIKRLKEVECRVRL